MALHRDLAPISDKAWKEIDEEARRVLELHLAARRMMDFEGPLGWEFSSVDLGRSEPLEGGPEDAARLRRRRVRSLVELRVSFSLERNEIERIDRGAGDPDLRPLTEAAKRFAAAEDVALFEGYADADVPGLVTDAGCSGVALPDSGEGLPAAVVEGLEQLRSEGVSGPYALALSPAHYGELARATVDGGQPVLDHTERLLEGPVLWAPHLLGGLIVSRRGGDLRFVCGRDASIGYEAHDSSEVRLYLEESFTAVLDGPEVLCPLLPSVPDTDA